MVRHDAVDVLIVEDEFAIREALTEYLEDEGYSVEGASHGQEALDYLRHALPPALIMLDLRMPVMNGVQFLAAIKADQSLTVPPIVLMSADRSGQHDVPPDSVAAHLDKPVRLGEVAEVVEQFCRSNTPPASRQR
jgi:two-component system, chemotaxis family, chemotaxis protein CheY